MPKEEKEPERFYHGFVLGLMVDRAKDYILKSNRESGYDTDLLQRGIPADRILKYGFAFKGAECLIKMA